LTAPLGGRETAVLDLVDGTTSIRVHAADLGGDLYRVTALPGSGLAPRTEQDDDQVRLFLPRNGNGSGGVDVTLAAGVRWTLRLAGGVKQYAVDMSQGKVDEVELSGGASRIDLALPKPQEQQIVVRMTGGVDQFVVHLTKPTPVRVRVSAGAGRVTVYGDTHYGIAPGKSFTAAGWADRGDGVDVQAVAGMSALSVAD
jgi:hypothetical protein